MMKIKMLTYFTFLVMITQVTKAIGQDNKINFPQVFPIPQEAEYTDEFFSLSAETVVLLPPQPSENDRFLARFIISELAEQHDLILKIEQTADLSGQRNYLLIGSVSNPLVRDYATRHNIPVSSRNPGHEGYFLQVNNDGAAILGSDEQGAFYGLQSLRQLINRHNASGIRYATIRDWPHMPFRGIHIYVLCPLP